MCRHLRRHWPFEWKSTICIVCVSFILILGLVIGILIGSNAIVQSKLPITLLHRERVTPGETYQIELNNGQSGTRDVCTSDLCSPSLCSQVTLTIDPTSILTGELYASSSKRNLTNTDTLIAALFDHTIKDTKSYSKLAFHLHHGSIMNTTLCAEATGHEYCTAENYNFAIIQGKENFSMWSSGDELPQKYTNYFTTLNTVTDCQTKPQTTLPSYTYPESTDYYHVIRNSARYDCDIRVFAYVILERKQYHNNDATPCTVGNNTPSCQRNTQSAKYVNVLIDTNTKVIDWDEQVSFSLTCDPIISSSELARKVVPAFVVPSLMLVVWSAIIVYFTWRKRQDGLGQDGQGQDGQERRGILESGQY